MFTEYQADVVREYEQKKAAPGFSERLVKVTTAGLKAECAEVCAKRYLRQDERALSRYFKELTDQQGYLDLINSKDADDFKSVYKFLNGKTTKPREEIIELSAWLIDFQPRPYLRWVKERKADQPIEEQEEKTERQEKEEEEKEKEKGLKPENEKGTKKEVEPKNKEKDHVALVQKKKLNKTALITIVVSITFAAVLVLSLFFKPVNPPPPKPVKIVQSNGRCMYWKGDHYEATACGQNHGDTLTLPLDSARLLHLRRIHNPRTSITYASIGHVWYFRTPDSLEYFTGSGTYPLDTSRRLLPITRYMIDHHIHP